MKLFHGTNEATAKVARRTGFLEPRGKRDSVWECASRPDMVYLTNAYPAFYSSNVLEEDESMLTICEVEVDEDNLYPDEDWLGQKVHLDQLIGQSLIQKTEFFRDDLLTYKHLWRLSLEGLGNVAHLGPCRVTRIAKVPTKFILFWDPTISILNFALMGDYYKDSVRWVFDGTDAYEPGIHSSGYKEPREGVTVETL